MRHASLLAVTALLALAACSSSDAPEAGPTPAGPSYVALGDSYTAGPQLAPTDARSAGCLRSTRNYPHLVATSIGATLTDVSCSGATTDNVLQKTSIPGTDEPVDAQLDAVTSRTDLVTVGIGGNDSGLFSSLSLACTRTGTACADYLDDKVPDILRSTRSRVVRVLDAVHDKAPDAQVVLVGYLRVSPGSSGCDVLGGAALDSRGVAAGERSIDRMLASAARAGDATYVSLNAVSKGHDACAGRDAWTNGLTPRLGDGAPLHPRKAGMEATAAQVEKVVRS